MKYKIIHNRATDKYYVASHVGDGHWLTSRPGFANRDMATKAMKRRIEIDMAMKAEIKQWNGGVS